MISKWSINKSAVLSMSARVANNDIDVVYHCGICVVSKNNAI